MKYFRMSYEEVVFKRSYINIMLLNRSIPSFSMNDKDKDDYGSPKKRKNKSLKEFHAIEGTMHANDFFMGFM